MSTLLANGVPLPLPLDVAVDVCEILIATKRATPPEYWVERCLIEEQRKKDSLLPHHRI